MRLTVGNISLSARKMPDGRWRCTYRDASGERRHITHGSEPAMREAMLDLADRLQGLEGRTRTVSESEWQDFQAWRKTDRSPSVGEAVEEFLASLALRPRRTDRTLQWISRNLRDFADAMGGNARVGSLGPKHLEQWIHANKDHAPRTRSHRRAMLVQFYTWLRDREFVPFGKTSAEKVPKVDFLAGKREILTPEQVETLLHEVKAQYLPFVLLGAFAGIRSLEIRPEAASHKDPLRWSDIDLESGWIRIRAETSKGRRGRPRLIPIAPNLNQWLQGIVSAMPRIGPVCPHIPFGDQESGRLGKLLGLGKWPQNCLRHSYGTYRMAQTRNIGQVAEEMGNSAADIRNHYDAVVSPAEAERFWRIAPQSDKDITFCTSEQ